MGESNEVDGSDVNLNFENLYPKKNNSFSPALFSMLHDEGFFFNAAHKPIHNEDGKALLTAESCSSQI